MNRISRRSADEAAEALLEAGRSQPALNYDVELGLARHQHWIHRGAPMPEWASASAGTAVVAPVVIKTLVSALLIGGLGVAAWHARGRPQPSATAVQQSSPGAEPRRAVPPNDRDVAASEAWRAPKPILAPLPDQRLPSDQPVRRTVRAATPDRRTTRVQRAHEEPVSARAASAPAVPRAETADATPARVEPAAPATTEPTEDVSGERATRREVAAAPERKPISAARRARPDPRPQAHVPDDLAEMQQVATAEQLLERSPERALALVRKGDQRFARGYFQQERAYIAIMALIRLGRIDEARARAESFAKQFPALPYGARIRSALEARQAPAPGPGQR
jgi:hypothetical protein